MNLHIPMAVCLTACLLAGCAQKLQQPDTQPHPTALNGNVQPARLDVYAASPEVVRYDRYLLVDTSPRYGNSSMFNGRRNALRPAWFWLTVMNVFRYTAIRQNQLLHIRLGDINLEERWIDLNIEGAKNHREHRVPIVSALYPSLEFLILKAGEVGMELDDQLFNVGWFDLVRKNKYPEVMNEYPLRAFFRRLSRECKFTITPHRFRHTVATHMMKSPERNLYAVKKLLGHVSITSTLEYIDESVDSLRDILETELM